MIAGVDNLEDHLETHDETPSPESLVTEGVVAASPDIGKSHAGDADSSWNFTNFFFGIDESFLNTSNITNSFPDLVQSLPNITNPFPNLVESLPNIEKSFSDIGGTFSNDTILPSNHALGVVDIPITENVTENLIGATKTTPLPSDMTTAKTITNITLQNVSTISTMTPVNSSTSTISTLNLSTTKDPITTLLSTITSTTTLDNDIVPDLNTTTSTCGSGYSVSDCDFIVNFERILSPILMVLIFIGLVANVYVVYTVIIRKDIRTFSNLFMSNLSVTHLIYLVVIGATDVYDYVLTVKDIAHTSVIPSSVHLYITLVITNCDVCMLTALSIDRYVAISVDPKKLEKYSKVKIATGTCVIVWIASLAVCAPVFYGVDPTNGSYDLSESSFKVAMVTSFVVSYVIPLIVITVVYFAIRRKLRKRGGASLRVKKDGVMVRRTPEEYRLHHDQQILRSILVIILLYTFNFGARYITKMIIYLSIPFGQIAIFVATQLSEVAAILTASLQPIVYVALHPTFSQHTREKFACGGGTRSFACCWYCGKCYIACCTCCGLIKLSPLPQASLRNIEESETKRNRKIDKVVLVENMELEIIPPPPSPTSNPTLDPQEANSPSSPSHPPISSPQPIPSSLKPISSPAVVPHTTSPPLPPSQDTPSNPPPSSSSPPPYNHIPFPPSYPPPSPPHSPPPHHSPPYQNFIFLPSPRPSSPRRLEFQEL